MSASAPFNPIHRLVRFCLENKIVVLLFAALSFARERELGTLEQLLVMPFSSLEIMVGKAIPALLIGFLDFLIMLGGIHFFFGVPVRGSLLLLFVLTFGYLLVELCQGLVISVISHSQHQAFLMVMMVGMTDFMFTGYAAPVESMPRVMQIIAKLVPDKAHETQRVSESVLLAFLLEIELYDRYVIRRFPTLVAHFANEPGFAHKPVSFNNHDDLRYVAF